MSTVPIQVTETPEADDLAFIGRQLSAFNDTDVGPSDRRPLVATAREGAEVVAGLSGYTAWGWLYVQWLWVSEAQRGRGMAATLLDAAEHEALRRGCHGAHIDTFSPQALHVYQKCGYRVFGTLPDFPKGRSRSFLCKDLR